jgi:dipeptidyl aminopeptidase/acylaminoacyl peptidase
MYQALKSLGRETELIIYPGEYHEIRTPSYRVDRQKRYLEWFNRYLNRQGEAASRR